MAFYLGENQLLQTHAWDCKCQFPVSGEDIDVGGEQTTSIVYKQYIVFVVSIFTLKVTYKCSSCCTSNIISVSGRD